MKKKFTFLLAALVLLGGLVGPMGKAKGQTSGNYTLNFLTSQTDTPVTSAQAMFGVSGMKYMDVASGANAATNLYLSSEGLKFGKDGQISVLALVTNSSYGRVKPTAISFTFAKPIYDVSFTFRVNDAAYQEGTIPSAGVGDERIVSVPITDGSALSRLLIATAATSPQMFVLKQIKVEYNADITASPSNIQLDTPVGTTTTGTFTINYSGLVEGSTIDFVVPSNHTYEGYLTLQPSSFTPSNSTCGSTPVVATWAPQEPVQNASIQCSANCSASGIADVTMGVTANAQSISPSPSSLSFSYAFGNETPSGEYVYVTCNNLGDGNTVTVSLGEGQSSHFELWDSESSQSEWNNLTQFTVTTTSSTNPNWFGFGFLVRLKPGYEQGSTHSDVVNLTATVNGNPVSATITLTGEVTAPTYNITFSYEEGINHGSYLGCDPSNVNVAGTLVTIRTMYLAPGYVLGPLTIYEQSTHRNVTNEVGLNGLTFTMPAYDLLIQVAFVQQSGMYSLTVEEVSNGYVSCSPQSPFEYLERVTLTPHPLSGYQYSTCHFTDENDNHVDNLINYESNGDGTYSFNMPDFNLVCHPSFVQAGAAATAAPTNVQVFDVTAHGYHFTFSPMSQEQTQWLTAITQTTETPTDHWGNTTDTWGGTDNHPNIYSNTRYYLWVSPKCGDWDNLEYHWSQPVEFTTTAECEVADEDFSCSVTPHVAILNFNNGRDWQVRWSSYNTMPETEPETVTGSYYSITGLDGDTDYHVWVRTECEQDWYGHKQWSEWRKIDIHTEVACPAPEALMVYGVTGTTATVWWFGAPYENPSWTVYLKARDHWGDWHSYTTNQDYFNFTSAQFDDEGETNWEDWTWEVYVTRNCGGEDGESAPSETITFTTAQYQDYTVNDGLETNTQVPIEGHNVDYLTMSQFIIPAKDLETMRYSNVSSMTFYCQEASVNWSSDAKFDVYLWNMPCGSENGFSGQNFFPWDDDDMKKVCEAKNLSITDYQMQVLFDETFLYTDGNLLVGIKQVQTGTSAACSWVGDYTNYIAAVTAFREDEENIYYDSHAFLPKVKFAYESNASNARPFHLEADPLNSTKVVLSWMPARNEMLWEVAFGEPGTFDPYNSTTWLHSSPNILARCQYTLSNHPNIQPEQEYEFVVRALGWDIGGNYTPLSDWTCPVSFTMPATCEATDIQVADITSTDATISWEGAENANVRYREAQILSENFDRNSNSVEGLVSDGWTIISESDNTGNYPTLNPNTHMGDEGSSFRFRSFYTNSSSTSYSQYLITPEIAAAARLSFYYCSYNDFPEYFCVGYSTTDNNVGSFVWGDEITAASATFQEFTEIIPQGTKYVAIYYNPRNVPRMDLFIDNFTIGNPNSTWNEQPAGTPFDICCLTPETTYEFQLQPQCVGTQNSDWTDAEYFATGPVKRFVGQEGEEVSHWNVASNWSPEGVPTIYEDVIIEHKAWIAGNQVGTARNITLTDENYLLLQEGAQLKHSNSGVLAFLQKVFYPYTGDNDHFYLVAPPTDEAMNPADIWLFLDDPYDLYRFDQSSDLEWRNYKQTPFNLEPGVGYLYAQGYQYQTTVNFAGELNPSENDYTILLRKDENADFSGWNLVGNPFACNAVIGNRNFYRIVETVNGSELVPATGNIAPLEGVFVQAATDGERLSFSRYGASSQNAAQPTIGINVMQNVTSNRGGGSTALVDKALVRFGEGQGLEKFQLNPKHTKLYVPMEGKDYAVACSQATQGEMPLNFKAEKDGTYTLSFDVENVELDYLHLIDNMTGADVDLLAGASTGSVAAYTFTAKTSDYASRFKVVFASVCEDANGDNETFAFNHNGNWIILNEGRATLQVVDVMGRVLSSETINGNAEIRIDQPAGVYMLRLVNGDDVKVQKVVVR